MRSCVLLLVCLSMNACQLKGLSTPSQKIKNKRPIQLGQHGNLPKEPVDLVIDHQGVPHIYGASETDLAFGLGFMHGRDRLFQLEVLRYASQGRLSEIFGLNLLDADRQLRLLSYRIDDTYQGLSTRDRQIMEAYASGINRGEKHVGTPTEMRLLRHQWTPFSGKDILFIIRFHAWRLSFNFKEEILRDRVLARLRNNPILQEELMIRVPSGGVSILEQRDAPPLELSETPPLPNVDGGGTDMETQPEDTVAVVGGVAPDGGLPPPVILDGGALERSLKNPKQTHRTKSTNAVASNLSWRAPAKSQAPLVDPTKTAEQLAQEVLEELGLFFEGASNAWVVSGQFTQSGKPILVADPHMGHSAPSAFYLVHLVHPEFSVMGASLPGVPGVVMGETPSMAWAWTTSYANSQDLLPVEFDPNRSDRYLVQGVSHAFEETTQTFLVDGEVELSETWRGTSFGPVLPKAFSYLIEPGKTYALQWTGFHAETGHLLSGLWDLYRATTLQTARLALEKITYPSQNVLLAFEDGTIGYHLMGTIPLKQTLPPTQVDSPQYNQMWTGTNLALSDKPTLTQPAQGFIVTANQRILDDARDRPEHVNASIGGSAAMPHRAQRIVQRLQELLSEKHAKKTAVTADELLAIQQDVISLEAKRLSLVFRHYCPKESPGFSERLVQDFCAYVGAFDGAYTKRSYAALPFTWLLKSIQQEIISAHLGSVLANQMNRDPAILMAVENAMLSEYMGTESPLLDDPNTPGREGLKGFVEKATRATLSRLINTVGDEPADWRWGKHHKLIFRNPMHEFPLLGPLFIAPGEEQAGWSQTPRAESGIPVTKGAVFRMVSDLGEHQVARMILDLGMSGHVGHRHFKDHVRRWNEGDTLDINLLRDEMLVKHYFILNGTPPLQK